MRVFLTGGTGFIGSNIIKVATERYNADIFTTVNRWQASEPVPFGYGAVDITESAALMAAAMDYRPDVIIHSAILNDFPRLYRERNLAWRSYVESTRALCDAANELNAKLIFVSTDWVFDGTQAFASEDEPPNPVNLYGLLKVVGETVVAERARNGAVARVAGVSGTHWLRGNDDGQHQNAGFGYFAAAVVRTLSNEEPFTVWEGDINMMATPGLASENAEIILRIASQDRQGIFHCCGRETIGRVALAEIVADVFKLDSSLLRSGPPPADDPAALPGINVARDTSLDASFTAKTLGYELLSVRELIERYRFEVQHKRLLPG